MKKLTNKEKQKELDFLKWNMSQAEKQDLSGKMDYCSYCPQQKEGAVCSVSQDERESLSLCAKALNRKNRG